MLKTLAKKTFDLLSASRTAVSIVLRRPVDLGQWLRRGPLRLSVLAVGGRADPEPSLQIGGQYGGEEGGHGQASGISNFLRRDSRTVQV